MGPLKGIRIVEMGGIGPSPMACMLLADLGADVIRIERVESAGLGVERPARFNLLLRGRRTVALDLKKHDDVQRVLELVAAADVLVEGFRPGVMERLGLGPDACLAVNEKLVYGRMTGWGQSGPLAHAAGHDVNYLSLTGVLNAIGREGQPPSIPLAVVGDMGGGALYLVMGILAAIIEAQQSGKGQVIDAAVVDGAASLATLFFGLNAAGLWGAQRGTNVLDSGAPFYDVYECADGRWISLGPIEAKFYRQLLEKLDLDPDQMAGQQDRAGWAQSKMRIAQRIKIRTREEWTALLEGTDVCFAPVLSFDEAPGHPHLKARSTFVQVDGITQPAPAPRFSRTTPDAPRAPKVLSVQDLEDVISSWRVAG